MTKPGKLHRGRKENTEGIIITEKLDNIKEFLGKFLIDNKGEVLCVHLMNHTVEITNQYGQHRPLEKKGWRPCSMAAQLHTATPTLSSEGR